MGVEVWGANKVAFAPLVEEPGWDASSDDRAPSFPGLDAPGIPGADSGGVRVAFPKPASSAGLDRGPLFLPGHLLLLKGIGIRFVLATKELNKLTHLYGD